jgi:NRAMP (natural resistance-associated macrophage protein)-like metal ion transporter
MEAETGAVKRLLARRLRGRRWARWRTGLPARLALLIAVIGPGIITANVDNDAGGITTYSLAGAQFGYTLLWTLVPITVALIVVQEMCARMGVITGKGLADLIREQYGVKVTFYIMVALLFANLANTVAEFAGVAAALEIFGISKYLSIPAAALFVWWLVVYGTYRRVENVFLIACLFYIAYPISGFLAHPPWGEVLVHAAVPEFRWQGDYLVMLIGIVGTTIAPWMQFYLQSAVVEKGVRPSDYRYSRYDVIVGCIVTDVVALFIIVACAATLYQQAIPIQSAQDAALALKPLAGKYCAGLFAFGLFNASLFAASVLPLSTAYYVCEGLGWETGIDRRFREAPQFFGLYTALIALGAAFILIPRFPLLAVMYLSQVLNGVLLPFVLIFVLLLVNRSDLMGTYVNSRSFNVIAWGTSVIMVVLTVAMVGALFVGS